MTYASQDNEIPKFTRNKYGGNTSVGLEHLQRAFEAIKNDELTGNDIAAWMSDPTTDFKHINECVDIIFSSRAKADSIILDRKDPQENTPNVIPLKMSVSKIAEITGWERQTIHNKIKEYNLDSWFENNKKHLSGEDAEWLIQQIGKK